MDNDPRLDVVYEHGGEKMKVGQIIEYVFSCMRADDCPYGHFCIGLDGKTCPYLAMKALVIKEPGEEKKEVKE